MKVTCFLQLMLLLETWSPGKKRITVAIVQHPLESGFGFLGFVIVS